MNADDYIQRQHARVDAVLNDVEVQAKKASEAVAAQENLMTEARARFAKAALYEQIIEGQLFEGDDAVTLEVEDEFKAFAEERLMVLLGMKADTKALAGQFEPDEVEALKALAGRALAALGNARKPQAPAQEASLRPARPAPAPKAPVVGTLAAPKRGRGRPPGTGKNQIAAKQAETVPAVQPAPVAETPKDPVAMSGKMVITTPSGKVKEVTVQKGQVKDTAARPPLPMPSPDEMVARAQINGEAGFRALTDKLTNG